MTFTVLAVASHWTQVRSVQFRKTSEMNLAATKGKTTAKTWVTKSTADFVEKSDAAAAAGLVKTDKKQMAKAHRVEVEKRMGDMTAWSEQQVARVEEFRVNRKKQFQWYFGQWGMWFVATYAAVYVIFLVMIYSFVSSDLIDKTSLFEMVLTLTGGIVDRDVFFEKVEAWGTYINVGFAVVLNECCDIIRFPMVIIFLWTFRFILRGAPKNIYRWIAPENAIKTTMRDREGTAVAADAAKKAVPHTTK